MRSSTAFRLTTVAALAAFALTGCAGTPSQSVADACAIAQEGMMALNTDAQETLAGLETAPEKAQEELDKLSGSLTETLSKITNEEVKEAASGIQSSFDGLVELAKTNAGNPENVDTSALMPILEDASTAQEKLAALCTQPN